MQQPTKSLDITPITPDPVDPSYSATPAQHTQPASELFAVEAYTDRPELHQARAAIASLHDAHGSVPATQLLPNQIVRPMVAVSSISGPSLSPLASATAGETHFMPLSQPTFPKATHHDKRHATKKNRVKPIIAAVGSFVLLLALFKSQIIFSQISYLGQANKASSNVPVITGNNELISADSVLNIPKINVSAPIVFVPTTEESQIQKALEGGVVHYGGTAEPGQKGNAVIVGHSSNDWWEPGNYKFVFVLLDKLIVGDTFSLNYKSTKYVYEVTEVKVVEPTELSVLAPTADPTITLITCTPPGTSWKRLVIKARQISPSPTSAVATTTTATPTPTGALPSNPPSFFEQIAQFFGGLFGGNKKSETPSAGSLPGL